jgi:hypothetical protein
MQTPAKFTLLKAFMSKGSAILVSDCNDENL